MSGNVVNTQPPETSNGADPAPGVGRLLKASRLRCGEELSDVAALLCIRYTYLEAIEDDRFQDLPGRAYAIGFIRAYAEHLGLDSAEVVRRFKEDSTEVAKTNLDFPIPVAEIGIPGGAILFIGAMIAVLAYGGWYLNTAQDGYLMELISPLPARLASLVGKDAADVADPSPNVATAVEPASVPAPPDPEQSAVTEAAESSPPPSALETVAEGAVSPDPAAETDDTPPGMIKTDAGPAPAAESDGPGEGVSAEAVPASPSEPGEGLSPEVAMGAEEETAAGEGPEPIPGEAEAQAESPAAPVDAVQDAAGTEQGAIPPATGGDDLPAAPGVNETEQAVPAPAPAEVEQDAVPAPAPAEVEQDAASAPAPAEVEQVAASAPAPAEVEQVAVPAPVPAEGGSAAAGTKQAAASPAAEDPVQTAAAPAAVEPEPAAAQPAAAPSAGRVFGAGNTDSRIEVRALMNSWIQVRDDLGNRLLMTRMLRAGDSYRVPDREGLKLLTGNAGALEILVDGQVVPSIGPVGKVLRAVALDSDRLRRGSAVDD
jgi:cytoskeletal protein RodZ